MAHPGQKVPMRNFSFMYFQRKTYFSVAKATLESPMSVHPSVCMSVCHRNPSASQNCSYQPLSLSTIEPIDHWAYQPSSLSTIKPINHQAYRPSSLSTIEPINHQAYQPSSLLTIEPINHQAYQPLSLSTSGLLLRLLSLSACYIFHQKHYNSKILILMIVSEGGL